MLMDYLSTRLVIKLDGPQNHLKARLLPSFQMTVTILYTILFFFTWQKSTNFKSVQFSNVGGNGYSYPLYTSIVQPFCT